MRAPAAAIAVAVLLVSAAARAQDWDEAYRTGVTALARGDNGRAAEAFRYRPEMGFHAEEEGPGGGRFQWTQRRFALRVPKGEVESRQAGVAWRRSPTPRAVYPTRRQNAGRRT